MAGHGSGAGGGVPGVASRGVDGREPAARDVEADRSHRRDRAVAADLSAAPDWWCLRGPEVSARHGSHWRPRPAAGAAFSAGVWLVELAAGGDPGDVDPLVAGASRFVPRAGLSARASIIDGIGDRELLLVLDNCEHLLDAAADFACDGVVPLPRLRILATSREPLGLDGERVVLVPSLTWTATLSSCSSIGPATPTRPSEPTRDVGRADLRAARRYPAGHRTRRGAGARCD